MVAWVRKGGGERKKERETYRERERGQEIDRKR
jgi:hypothetical protein